MSKFFDEKKWEKAVTFPDWYLQLFDEYKSLIVLSDAQPELKDEIKKEVYDFFEWHLREKTICLGEEGFNFDKDRKPIDMMVVHHTSQLPGITLERLSAIHLVRLYSPYYANPYTPGEKHIKGLPIYSGHFRDTHQVFYAYHWLVRNDGSVERLLADNEIGWHAGNWEVNCRSIAICIDDDLATSSPSMRVLYGIAELMHARYPQVSTEHIVGHSEVNQKTDCPGSLFVKDWKQKLVDLI